MQKKPPLPAPPPPAPHLAYNPALDGLRALAIVLVFCSHAHVPGLEGAFLGVDLFFVLSGYLITSLLLKESASAGRLDYARFYWRRFLRLGPALLLFLAAYWLLAPRLWPSLDDVPQDVLMSALYLADYGIAFFDSPGTLLHMWSLSVEEHFYLLWPPLLACMLARGAGAASRPPGLWRPVLLLALLAWAWRALWVARGQLFYEIFFRFDTRATGMLLGSALAAVAVQRPAWLAALHARRRHALWLLPALALCLTAYKWDDMGALLLGVTVAELAAAAVIVTVHPQRGALFALLAWPPLVWLGKLSYGIYLWHYPVVRLLRAHMEWPWTLAIGLPLSAALAALSFFTVERWALAWRNRARPAAAPTALPAPARH